MNFSFSQIISLIAIIISIVTFAFTVIKAVNDRKKNIATKRTEVLIQLATLILMLENILIEQEKWLEAEIKLWPGEKNNFKRRSHEEQDKIKTIMNEIQKHYDEISNMPIDITQHSSRWTNPRVDPW